MPAVTESAALPAFTAPDPWSAPVPTLTNTVRPSPAPRDAMEDILAMLTPAKAPRGVLPAKTPSAAQRSPSLPENADIPTSVQALYTPSQPEPAKQPSAEHFIAWLREGIQSRKIIINDAKALVHTVAGTAYLVSPGILQRYVQENPQSAVLARREGLADWQWIQKRFEMLQLHRKQSSGLNIWTCEVTGPRKTKKLHGYLLNDPSGLFQEVPPNNPYLTIVSASKPR